MSKIILSFLAKNILKSQLIEKNEKIQSYIFQKQIKFYLTLKGQTIKVNAI